MNFADRVSNEIQLVGISGRSGTTKNFELATEDSGWITGRRAWPAFSGAGNIFSSETPSESRRARGEYLIDAGSLFGDTAVAFATAVGDEGHFYALDPLESHGQIGLHNIRQNGLENRIDFFPVGLGCFGNEVPDLVKEEKIVNPGFSYHNAVGINCFRFALLTGS